MQNQIKINRSHTNPIIVSILLTVLLVMLKVSDFFHYSWWVALAPTIMVIGVVATIAFVAVVTILSNKSE